jgi:hypothetical protein
MRKVWIGSIVLIVLVIVAVYFGSYYYSRPKTRANTLSNITELYFSFAPYMKDFVDSYLKVMNCEPNQYYYTESKQVCFVCGKFDVCYGYSLVNRNGVKLMNPTELFLVGEYNQKTLLNLYSYGVADALNCNCIDKECSCESDITVHMEEFGNVFIFPEDVNIETEVETIAKKMGKYECETISNDTQIKCRDLVATRIKDNEVTFGKW